MPTRLLLISIVRADGTGLRALGFTHDDGSLALADEGFARLGLEWHRRQTQHLVSGR